MLKKILNIIELNNVLDTLKKENKKIVFTNGCFDILHRGHVEYLQKSRELGDFLILGLNSDSSVKRLKGNDRPINNENDRAAVLSALECIDYICIFDEDTPFELIKALKPDILAKGGDYKTEDVVGREFSKETVIIDFVDGYSTTNIIKKING
ncbi:D-glycero-beta-D-manno-heptose 1-phosphate adenylyltransferase [uncultured Brachyspira sp.]|uniref:D-glycero-beta-D-manno-heptose 1-phosphate adenylyltransferase n=1 Tax=uncultured Brachyspira sp. TaxID=221953 RepID=UPI0025DF013C|nr:D-glycero-beta-D-manno-heptose 1-phosphate adenylyltransferase [uncultured Brachyspira sp.]